MTGIERLSYTISGFDFGQFKKKTQCVVEISSNGTMEIRKFGSSGKCASTIEKQITPLEFRELCGRLTDCIDGADRRQKILDDLDATLHLYCSFGREEIIPRGLGNAYTTIHDIMTEFFRTCQV